MAQANRELRRLDRVRSDLLANVSHELKTPLIPISSLGQLMLSGKTGPLTDGQRDYLQAMIRSAGHLQRFSEQLLGTVRRDQGREPFRPIRLDLCQMLRESADTVSPAIETKNLHFDLQLPEELLWVAGDSSMLHQVFDNLLSNAAKFTPAGGRVTLAAWIRSRIGTRHTQYAMRRIKDARHNSKLQTRNSVIVEVRDTGMGISEKNQPHIFERFYQATGGGYVGGTGLGLAIVKDLVELHGGGSVCRVRSGRGVRLRYACRERLWNDEAAASPFHGRLHPKGPHPTE